MSRQKNICNKCAVQGCTQQNGNCTLNCSCPQTQSTNPSKLACLNAACASCPTNCNNPCHRCPPFVLPSTTCTQGLRLYVDEIVTLTGTQTLEGIFNSNDGPSPYTLESAEITGIQQAIVDASIVSMGVCNHRFAGTATVYVQVDYMDGLSVSHSKLVQLPVPLSIAFQTTDPVSNIVLFSELISGMISNPVLSGTTLTFTANISLHVLGVSDAPERFPVLTNFSCTCPPPSYIPATCMNILQSSMTAEGAISLGYDNNTIPFNPNGATAPYTVEDMQIVDSASNVLSAVQVDVNQTTFTVSFPVHFIIVGANGVRVPQESGLFSQFTLDGIAIEPGANFVFNIRPTSIIDPLISGNVIVAAFEAAGSISIVAASGYDVATTTLTDCGDPAINMFTLVAAGIQTTPPPPPN